ncbi:hypothetical protein VNO77_27275 [Canavalia gladiata]|uniref:Uncharacterized protein n=1 Tax=Canavalia gladiata TaxID=3824 RepID=A0AAN9KXK2_CANGL
MHVFFRTLARSFTDILERCRLIVIESLVADMHYLYLKKIVTMEEIVRSYKPYSIRNILILSISQVRFLVMRIFALLKPNMVHLGCYCDGENIIRLSNKSRKLQSYQRRFERAFLFFFFKGTSLPSPKDLRVVRDLLLRFFQPFPESPSFYL